MKCEAYGTWDGYTRIVFATEGLYWYYLYRREGSSTIRATVHGLKVYRHKQGFSSIKEAEKWALSQIEGFRNGEEIEAEAIDV